MKVMVWVLESNLELLNDGDVIQYWLREPGDQLQVVQVELTYNEFIRLKDNQPNHYSTHEFTLSHIRFTNYSGLQDDNYISDNLSTDGHGYGVED